MTSFLKKQSRFIAWELHVFPSSLCKALHINRQSSRGYKCFFIESFVFPTSYMPDISYGVCVLTKLLSILSEVTKVLFILSFYLISITDSNLSFMIHSPSLLMHRLFRVPGQCMMLQACVWITIISPQVAMQVLPPDR